ncbi:MAG TPA: acyltransferase family protein [Humibacter sp.]|nr:acyltransferase family protein [Humibacter sp.]
MSAKLPARPFVPPVPSAPATPTRLGGLDGLRALAVIAVIGYHFLPNALPGGFIGVDVFFVISGFLITTLLLTSMRRKEPLRRFWARRARRLLPALVVVVLVCSTVAVVIGGDVLVDLGAQVLGAVTFSSNWVDIGLDQSYFASTTPELFRNLWSLGVEEQFYVVWPVIMLVIVAVLPRRARAVAALALGAASAIAMALMYAPGSDPSRVYYGTDTHFFGLAFGATLALALDGVTRYDEYGRPRLAGRLESRWAPAVGAVSLLVLAAFVVLLHDTDAFAYDGGLVVASVAAVGIVWSATRHRAVLGRMLDIRPLRAVGVRSYGIYLWHLPIWVLLTLAWPTTEGWPSMWTKVGVALALTAAAGWLSYRFVESPIRSHGFGVLLRPFRPGVRHAHPVAFGGACAALVLVMVGVASTSAAAVQSVSYVSSAQRQVDAGRAAIDDARAATTPKAPPSTAATPHATPSPAPSSSAPKPGPTSSSSTPAPTVPGAPAPRNGSGITAIGDSVMLASAPALLKAFPGIDIDAVVSRSPRDAPALITQKAAAGKLRPVVLIGLGTNGYLGTGTLDRVLQAAGPDRTIVFVNIYADKPWLGEVDGDLAAFVAAHPGRTALADWHDAIAQHQDLLGPDHIHPDSAGGQIYASCVAEALDRLD